LLVNPLSISIYILHHFQELGKRKFQEETEEINSKPEKESETKPNKAHHENGQKKPLDPVKIGPTNL